MLVFIMLVSFYTDWNVDGHENFDGVDSECSSIAFVKLFWCFDADAAFGGGKR